MHKLPWLVLIFCVIAVACSEPRSEIPSVTTPPGVRTTFEKFLLKAEYGDAEAQNLIGYMLFFGEGVAQDRASAQFWFERAAVQAHPGALLNLAVMLYSGAGTPRDLEMAIRHFKKWRAASQPASGITPDQLETLPGTVERFRSMGDEPPAPAQSAFERFCAGCHGLNGIAAYVGSPSFAIGERLHKKDGILLASIKAGHGNMPAWGDLLDKRKRQAVLDYIRTFPNRFKVGIALPKRDPPKQYFTFGPMRNTTLAR